MAGGRSLGLQEQEDMLWSYLVQTLGIWAMLTQRRANAFLCRSFIHSSNSLCGHAYLHFSMTTPGQQGVRTQSWLSLGHPRLSRWAGEAWARPGQEGPLGARTSQASLHL